MVMFIGLTCPECGNQTVFPTTRMIEIDGETYGPISVKCSTCSWEPSDEEVIANWKKEKDKCSDCMQASDCPEYLETFGYRPCEDGNANRVI